MKSFIDDNYLLENRTAEVLYHNYAKNMPIIDYHCHINPKEIYDNRRYDSVTEVWLGGDHYKWRLLRADGMMESEITGSIKSDPYLVFENFATMLPKAIGNPVYSWTHMELKRYFSDERILSAHTTREIYDSCNEKLKYDDMRVRSLINRYNVKLICTVDDPIDDLVWHRKLRDEGEFDVVVLPTFRPDKAMNIEKEDYIEYINELSELCDRNITCFKDLCNCLLLRMDYFKELGCKLSDHALEHMVYSEASEEEIDRIFSKAVNNEKISIEEADCFRTMFLLKMAELYNRYDWAMQIHFGCSRDVNSKISNLLGVDVGVDATVGNTYAERLAPFMNNLYSRGVLPKCVVHSLNSSDNEIINIILTCFNVNSGIAGKLQSGAAWWFNDTKAGIEKHLTDLANVGLLGNFVGMLTDSRSFLSYVRHEYFRRILCNFIGSLVENGEYPEDYEMLEKLVCDICYNNVVKLFRFDEDLITNCID